MKEELWFMYWTQRLIKVIICVKLLEILPSMAKFVARTRKVRQTDGQEDVLTNRREGGKSDS